MESIIMQAKFKISATELEISGPAEFVKDQVQVNKNIIDFFGENIKHRLLEKEPSKALDFNRVEQLPSPSSNGEYAEFEEVKESDSILNKYKNIIAINGDKIQVLSKIHGNSTSAKMLKLILIYLFFKTKAFSIEKVHSADIRNFCEIHGELDAAHFSENIKKNKRYFLIDGSSKNTTVMLTVPGMKEALQILDSMNNL